MFEEDELENFSDAPNMGEVFEGLGVSPITPYSPQSPFMDKVFEREFKQTMAYIKSMSPTVFGLHHLELTQSPIGSELLSFVKIKGLSSENLFKELEDCEFVFISTKKEFSEKGHLAYSKLNLQSVKAPKGCRLVACASAIPIPNGYKSPDPQIEYVGLMTMAPFEATSQELQEIFKETQELQKTIQEKHLPNMPMTELSMGMSRDFKEAIQFGSTFVRIGTAFFK